MHEEFSLIPRTHNLHTTAGHGGTYLYCKNLEGADKRVLGFAVRSAASNCDFQAHERDPASNITVDSI